LREAAVADRRYSVGHDSGRSKIESMSKSKIKAALHCKSEALDGLTVWWFVKP